MGKPFDLELARRGHPVTLNTYEFMWLSAVIGGRRHEPI